MYLTELHIQGFKSFARSTDLTFPSTVTAIVGPNGSGKSNVAEALRFVLGEQSVKSMRGKRTEDLIWGGSDAVARSNRASVTLRLNNTSRVLSLDTDTVTIERVVHRDGQSEYKINDQTVRLKDVHELLAAGNIGPSGHHIISQGEADRVLSATPQERRAMIEEALGLKVYQYKKIDADKKLAKTEQNIREVQNLRKEIAPHLKYLERELQKIDQARSLKEKLQSFYSEYLRREDLYLAHEYERVAAEKQKISSELATAEKEIEKLQATIPTMSSDFDTVDTTKREEIQEAQEKWRQAEESANQIAGHLAALEQQIGDLEVVDRSEHIPIVAVEEQWSSLLTETEMQAANNTLSGIQAAYDTLRDQFSKWLQNARGTVEKTDHIKTLIERKETLQTEYETYARLAKEAQEAYEQAEQDQRMAEAAVREAHREREVATKSLYEAKSAASQLRATFDRCTQELSLIERERQVFKDDLQEAVALLGRAAAEYFSYVVTDTEGKELAVESMLQESRSVQRERKRELERMKIRLETLGEGTSDDLEKEYKETKERDDFLAGEIADLETSVETLQQLITDLDKQIDQQFQEGFARIQKEFQSFFALMFGGGTAELKLVAIEQQRATEEAVDDTETAIQRGIELSLALPNKRISGLAMLSGGERALTSTALIFAMSQVYPPLFIVLDETDAALDEANSRRYGDLIEALAERSQLVVITHNRETMSRAGTLYGVTMGETGVSQLLSVQFDEALQSAKR